MAVHLFEVGHAGGRFYVAAENILDAAQMAKREIDEINAEGQRDDDTWYNVDVDKIEQIGDNTNPGIWRSH